MDSLDPFVPVVAANWDRLAPGARCHRIHGTLVFVDISGFTSLSERLARRGRIGAEELTSVLDRVFSKMLDIVRGRGGSLLKFGGDALLLLFDTEDHVLQACAATVEMRAALRAANEEPTSVGRIDLRMSSGVHSGPIDLFLVGNSHRELILTGPTATGTTLMESTAEAGEIVVSPEVRERLPAGYTGDPKGKGWLLRKRRIDHPPVERAGTGPISESALSSLVPVALRDHLATGMRDSEHRIATVGFVNFKGVDSFLAERGPVSLGEELDRMVAAIQDAVDEEGVTFLASDIDSDGGKIILVTGVPSSQHDDEGRLLRAARRILDTDLELTLRVGVNRGHVFSGSIGSTSRRTYTVMGDTVNLAARLMSAAGPGMLYATVSALDLSSTLFRTEAMEPFKVKGKEHPVQAYAVFEETGVRPPELENDLPFHGRTDELRELVAIVSTCATVGRGGIMTISGEVGVGKSRLIAEVIDRCPGLDTLLAQAEPPGKDNPYWAFRDPMRRMLGIDRDSQQVMARQLAASVGKRAPALKWAIPLIADVIHIDVPDNEDTVAIDPRFRPERTAEAVVDLLQHLHRGPFAVVAEDGQWLDEASIGLLERIGTAAESRPWTVIVTARRNGDDFQVLGGEVALEPLGDEAIRSIAIAVTAAAPLRPHVLDAIVSKAGGNPLFLSEILRVIRETGSAEALPESLGATVSIEIDTLPPLARRLLRYASVLGRSFRRPVLDAFLAPDEVRLDDATEQEISRFIVTTGPENLSFRHAVVHDVAYEGLSYRRRKELHARAGDVIERMAGDDPDTVAEYLSSHYSLAGVHDKVWRYARVAADRAKSTYANTEASAQYRKAIEAAAHLDRIDTREVAEIWTRMGEVQDLAGQYEDAREAYTRALRLAGDDPVRAADLHLLRARAWLYSGQLVQAKRNLTLGRKRLDSTRQTRQRQALARLEAYEASVHAARGDPAKALRLATAAADLARQTSEEEALARAYSILDWANFVTGRGEPRRGPEAIEILERLGLIERSVGVMNNMGAFAYLEGNWDEAIDWYRRAVEAAERCGNVVEAARTRANIAEVLVGQRKYAEALPYLGDAERVYRSSKTPQGLPFTRMVAARAAVGMGDLERGLAELEDLYDEQLRSRDTSEDPEIVVHLAHALVEADRPEDALERLDGFVAMAASDADEVAAGINRVRALALSAMERDQEAMPVFETALAAATENGNFLEELLTLQARGQSLARAGETADPDDSARVESLIHLLGVSVPQPT
jgi:class 3 adenylate cyclase/tetratricopeptide (TPR) repeat protein